MGRALVTGGAGFLGSYLCEALLDRGHEVICMDNFITGDIKNIEHLFGKKFRFIEQDVTDFIHISGELDYVLHFASPASPIDYYEYPIQTLKVGSLGTHKTLGLAKSKGATYLMASTSEVYGDPQVHPQPETYYGHVNPIGPRGVYDEAKRFAEAMVMAYHNYHQLDTRIVRIFNTFGPRMRGHDGRAVPTFITQAMRGEDITVFGDGSQTRSFTYVTDTIEGIMRLLESNYNLPVNIGNPVEISIKTMAEAIMKDTGCKGKIIYQDLPQDDPKVRQPDISTAREVLKWEPKTHWREGLKSSIDWFMKNQEQES